MKEIIEYITNNLGSIIGYIFGVVGLVSAYWAYRSYRDGIKQNKRYSVLFDAADKKIEKEILEKELMLSKKEKDEINKDISLMKEDISANIPIAAKKAALVSKLEEQLELLSEQYNSVCETRKKLSELSDDEYFMSEVEEIVKGEITPSYYEYKEKQKMKDKILVIILLILLINQFVPNPIRIMLYVTGITYVLPDIKVLFKYNENNLNQIVENFIIRALAITSVMCNIIVSFWVMENDRLDILLRFSKFDVPKIHAVLSTSILSFLVMFIMMIKFIYRIQTHKKLFIVISGVLSIIYLFMYFCILSANTITVLISGSGIKNNYKKNFFISIAVAIFLIVLPKIIKFLCHLKRKRRGSSL